MPGTIHVSVFDLMDLPFEGSPIILKFAMGKREYQTGDKGECSFPVMSLRENLVLMLHDKEGNEISRTEFRTMSVVEKGIWDDLFPLKGGGHIRMRVQFSLSEEERLRIREMRESVVRKKQSELLKGKETGLLGPYPTTEDNTKIVKAEQTDPGVYGNPFGTLSLQEFGESSIQSFKQNDLHRTQPNKKEIEIQCKTDVSSVETYKPSSLNELKEYTKHLSELRLPDTTDIKKETIQMKPAKVEEQQLDAYEENISEDSSSIGMENDQILGTRRNSFHRRSSSGNVRKRISTFETNLYEGLETHISPKVRTRISKFDTESSMKREFSESNGIKNVEVTQSMTKSFSAGMLSEIKSQQHSTLDRPVIVKELEKSQLYSDLISCDKKMMNNVQELIEIERATSIGGMAENSNERNVLFQLEAKNGPSIISINEEFVTKTAPREVASLHLYSESSKSGEQTRTIGTEHNPTDETTQDRGRGPDINQTLEWISVDDLRHSDKASFDFGHKQETKNENHVLAEEDSLVRNNLDKSLNSVGPCPCINEDSSFSTAIQRSEQINCQTSNEDVLLSRFSDSRGCSSRSPVSCVPRQLCITIGSKQLRDLIECCDLSVGTHLMEHHHFINEIHEKESAQGETLLQVGESEDISPTSEGSNLGKSKSIEKSSGVLIEQVVRTVLVIVACGTLILNTRLRRPR